MSLQHELSEFLNQWPAARNQPLRQNDTAEHFRKNLRSEIKNIAQGVRQDFLIRASVGLGSWAEVPYICILRPEITRSPQNGIYPVYLFRADGQGFYLSLNQGVTQLRQKNATRAEVSAKANEIRTGILAQLPDLQGENWDNGELDLAATTRNGREYQRANIAAKFYATDQLPDDEVLANDLESLLSIYAQVPQIENIQEEPQISQDFLPKPFLLLAGISGTGKTRFIRKQAEASGQLSENYCLTSVRPDWHEPSDLLGYISRLSVDGQSEYVTTDPLQFMAKAWREIIDKGLTVGLRELDQRGLCLVVSGNLESLNTVKPYWLCLDEMNLAPVEQYFSDYLSVLETREWKWEDTSFQYTTDALLKPATINQVHQSRKLREDLGFGPEIYNFFWDAICQFGMPLPFNLIVAGTVNVDETTHGFSRKVIDRALTFDFGEFFPNHFRSYLNPETDFKKLTFPILSDSRDYPHSINEQYRTDTIQFLESVNHILKTTPFELAYRALNEILIAVISTEPEDEMALKAVWDDFMMCKVLPRIEGDIDKLTAASGINILEELENLLAHQLEPIWAADLDNNPSNQRPDLFRQRHGADMNVDEPLRIPCRTKQKLSWMKQRLRSAKFTSFWP